MATKSWKKCDNWRNSQPADFAFKITVTVKTLPVNFSDLALALQDQGGELHVYYFDTETGAVLNLSEDIDEPQLHESARKVPAVSYGSNR
jgi:hypothetical protein